MTKLSSSADARGANRDKHLRPMGQETDKLRAGRSRLSNMTRTHTKRASVHVVTSMGSGARSGAGQCGVRRRTHHRVRDLPYGCTVWLRRMYSCVRMDPAANPRQYWSENTFNREREENRLRHRPGRTVPHLMYAKPLIVTRYEWKTSLELCWNSRTSPW